MEPLSPLRGDDEWDEFRDTEVIPSSERKSTFAKEAWARVSPKVKLVLTTSVEVWSYGGFSQDWVTAEIRVVAAMPSVLHWTGNAGRLQQLDFVQTLMARSENESFGIKVGIVPNRRGNSAPPDDTSPEQFITFRTSSIELTIVLPKSIFGDWKKALSALLKAYIRVEENHSSKPTEGIRNGNRFDKYFLEGEIRRERNIGSVFDISWTDDKEEHCTNIKLTCISCSSTTNTEFLVFDRERRGIGKSKVQLTTSMSTGKLDPANQAVFQHFMDELEILEANKSLCEIRPNSSLRADNEVFACMTQSLYEFLPRDHTYEWWQQFDLVYSQYRTHAVPQLKKLWQARASIQFDTEGHPCAEVLRLSSLYIAATQMAVAGLLQSKSGPELMRDISQLHEISELEATGQRVSIPQSKSDCLLW